MLSHAHIDHSGRLPMLARHGYRRSDLRDAGDARSLRDHARRLGEHSGKGRGVSRRARNRPVAPPLYDMRDVAKVMSRMICIPYDTPFDVAPGIRATFVEAGHILGSASVVLDCTEGDAKRRLVFSADIGRWGLPIIRDPQPPGGADVVIMESTYGNRDHTSVDEMPDRLAQIIRETAAKGGRVIIPAFAVGRTQELLYDLHRLTRANAIPAIPIVLDSPLAIAATTVFATNPEAYDRAKNW